MSVEDLEKYEAEMELALYREYRDVLPMFAYVVETEKRFYLCNDVRLTERTGAGEAYFEIVLTDAWVWDIYRTNRFVASVRVLTPESVNIEELRRPEVPESPEGLGG